MFKGVSVLHSFLDTANDIGDKACDGVKELYFQTGQTLTRIEDKFYETVPQRAITFVATIASGVATDFIADAAMKALNVQSPALDMMAGPIVGGIVGYFMDNMGNKPGAPTQQAYLTPQFAM